MIRRTIYMAALSMVMLGSAFALGERPDPPVSSYNPTQGQIMLVDISTDKTIYKIGEPVRLILKVTNISTEIIAGYYSSSCRSNFFIYDEKKCKIWERNYQKCFLAAVYPFNLEPGKHVEAEYLWEQETYSGKGIKPGNYYVQGEITVAPKIISGLKMIKVVEKTNVLEH